MLKYLLSDIGPGPETAVGITETTGLVIAIVMIAMIYFGLKTRALLWFFIASANAFFLAWRFSESGFLLISFIMLGLALIIYGIFGGKGL